MPPLNKILIDNLRDICINHCSPGRVGAAPTVITKHGTTVSFDAQASSLIHSTAGKIIVERPKVGQSFSEEFIEEKLVDIVFLCHSLPSSNLDANLRREISRLIAELKSPPQSWVFFVPIINLEFTDFKKMSVGPVNFYKLDLPLVKYLSALYKARALSRSLKRNFSDMTSRGIRVISVVKVEAGESEKAKNKAILRVESALNILRFYNFTDKFATQREFLESYKCEELFWSNLTTNTSGSSTTALSIESFFVFKLNKIMINQMKKHGFSDFSKLLVRTHLSELELKLLSSFHWYGLAIKDRQNVDRFVKLVISLESLLLNKNEEPKKHLLADRAAFLLGKSKKQREEIFKDVAEAYSLRGDIVHQGRHEFSIEETDKLIQLLRALIFKLTKLTRRYSDLKEIGDKIKEIKFGSKATI